MPERSVTFDAVLAHVVGVIEREGEAAVRVRDVCTAVGITAPVLYEMFDGREALVVAAQAKRYNDSRLWAINVFRETFASIDNADDFRAMAQRFLAAVLDDARSAHRAMRTNVLGSVLARPALQSAISVADQQFVEVVRQILGRAQAKGWVRQDVEVGAVALLWVSIADGRFHVESLDSGVDKDDWDRVAIMAANYIWLGR